MRVNVRLCRTESASNKIPESISINIKSIKPITYDEIKKKVEFEPTNSDNLHLNVQKKIKITKVNKKNICLTDMIKITKEKKYKLDE